MSIIIKSRDNYSEDELAKIDHADNLVSAAAEILGEKFRITAFVLRDGDNDSMILGHMDYAQFLCERMEMGAKIMSRRQ